MGFWNKGSDAAKAELQREAQQQQWVADNTKDPVKRSHAHGRLDEIDEALEAWEQ